MSDFIKIENLLYSYGSKVAVDIPLLEVKEGDLFGIIGADGAGKTTLFRLLATLFKPMQGKITLFGNDTIKDFYKIRSFTGYMPSKFSLYEDLTIKENMDFFASVFETTLAENYSLIEDIYSMLKPFESRKAGKLSGGMKQKLALCSALIHKPRLLLLDEATTGVDPASRQEFWEMLLKLQKKGITIIVSTPYLDEASLCNKLALMHKSQIIAWGKTSDFISNFPKKLFHIKASEMRKLLQQLRDFPSCHSAFSFGDCVHYQDKRVSKEKGDYSPRHGNTMPPLSEKGDLEKKGDYSPRHGNTMPPLSEKGDLGDLGDLEKYLKNLGQSDIIITEEVPSLEDAFIEYLQEDKE